MFHNNVLILCITTNAFDIVCHNNVDIVYHSMLQMMWAAQEQGFLTSTNLMTLIRVILLNILNQMVIALSRMEALMKMCRHNQWYHLLA